jgi:glutaredoxin-related protein
MLWTKRNAHGQIVHHKVRFIVKGYTQKHKVDFNNTFVLVVKFTSIRVLLVIDVLRDLEIYQVDFKSAFLNGDF